MCGYVYQLTSSRVAGLVSGISFGLSGFMVAHLVHAIIIQTAVWFPLIMWSLESQRAQQSKAWLIIGGLGIALSLLGGQPQISLYGLTLSATYAATRGWSSPRGKWQFYSSFLLMVAIGFGLAAIQLIPTAELFRQRLRSDYSFEIFVSHSLPPRQLLTLIFPLSFGVREFGAMPYFGAVNQVELTGYVGLLPLMLASLGVVISHMRNVTLFWVLIALVGLILVMGEATPLARIVYQIPIISGFRAPARHFFEFTFAVSVLAGLGTAAICEHRISARQLRRVLMFAAIAMLIVLGILSLNLNHLAGLATGKGITRIALLSWLKQTTSITIIVFLLELAALVWFQKNVRSVPRQIAFLSILIIDLASCGWFYDWRYSALSTRILTAPEIVNRYERSLSATNQRLLSPNGVYGSVGEVAPYLSRLWGIPSAGGCNPLMISRIGQTLSMTEVGTVRAVILRNTADSGFDLMAARYVFMSPHQLVTDAGGGRWFSDDDQQWLGLGCDPSGRTSFTVSLPAPVKSTALGVVSRLACSTNVTDGTEVARVRIVDTSDQVTTRNLVAGRDTSEWAYDCESVHAAVRHQRAAIFSNYPAQMYDKPCPGHFYVSRLHLEGMKEVKRLEFEWVKGAASLIVEKLSLIDETSASSVPLDAALSQPERWRLVEEGAAARVYENLRALPRAWLTNEVLTVTGDEALHTIKSGTLKDGRAFDPQQTVLLEEPVNFTTSNADRNASVTVTSLSDTRMEVRTVSNTANFLVTSDAYYPGWRVLIDGQQAKLYRADYAIRGLVIPPGQHLVSFVYEPKSFYFGAVVSVCSLITLVAIGVWSWRSRVRQ